MKSKITFLNSISALLVQITSIISGFIVPRIILVYFGSSINGLVSSIAQFLGYISLIEGGITGVIYANLYKPLVEQDEKKISAVLVTAKKFYKKIGYIFVVYSLVLAVVYPIYINKNYNFCYAFFLTIVMAMSLFVQYMFSLTLKTLLTADKKLYVVSFTQIGITVLNIILVYFSVKVYPNIHLIKFIGGTVYIFQPIVFGYYVNKHYNIDWKEECDNRLLKERWNGFAVNIAAFIHMSTDITVLTLFANLKDVSVYCVYTLATNGLSRLVQSISSGINPTIGQAYANNNVEELNKKLDLYEYIIFFLVGILFTVAALQIIPFVMIYTENIADADYYQPAFGYFIILSEVIYLLKFPHLNLAYSANKFKEITIPAYIEAGLNIIISVMLVKKLGLIGIAVGTISAMIYRLVFHIYYSTKIVINRKQSTFYKKLLVIVVATMFAFIICKALEFEETNYGTWFLGCVLDMVIVSLVYVVVSFLFFKKEYRFFVSYMKKGKKQGERKLM